MTHDIKKNKYDVEIIEDDPEGIRHNVKVRTFLNGEEYVKQFNFTHDQTPGGELDSWKKHIRHWVDKLEESNEHVAVSDKEGGNKFNVDKSSSV